MSSIKADISLPIMDRPRPTWGNDHYLQKQVSAQSGSNPAMPRPSMGDENPLFQKLPPQLGSNDNEKLDHPKENAPPAWSAAPVQSAMDEESVESQKKTIGQRIGQHLKRRWYLYVIGLVVFLAIFLPLLFVKIIPAVAQNTVNKSAFPIYSANLKALSNNQVEIGLQTAVDMPSGFSGNLDTFDISLYNRDSSGYDPFAKLTVPGQQVKGHTVLDIANQKVTITNQDEFVKLLRKTYDGQSSDISFRGDATVHLGAIKAPVHIDKTVQIGGLKRLAGLNVPTISLKSPADPDGTNIVGNITFPNPSSLTLGLGNLTVNTFVSGILVGNVTVNDVLLSPGNTTLPFRGQLLSSVLTANLVTILANQTNDVTSGNLQLEISGNSTIANGEHITYFEDILNPVMLSTSIPIAPLLASLGGTLTTGLTRRHATWAASPLGLRLLKKWMESERAVVMI